MLAWMLAGDTDQTVYTQTGHVLHYVVIGTHVHGQPDGLWSIYKLDCNTRGEAVLSQVKGTPRFVVIQAMTTKIGRPDSFNAFLMDTICGGAI